MTGEQITENGIRKKAEIDYPAKLGMVERQWLETKPFGTFNREESKRIFQDFATILNILERHARDAKTLLELGCGPGWLAIFLAHMGYRVTATDLAPGMLTIAEQRGAAAGVAVRWVRLDMEDDDQTDWHQMFEVVMIYDALHHTQNDQKTLAHTFAYLRPGGVLILAEPNRSHETDTDAAAVRDEHQTTERGLDAGRLQRICRSVGFRHVWRYHASGQSFTPRHEGWLETLKMVSFPFLARFIFGRFRTRIWLVAKK